MSLKKAQNYLAINLKENKMRFIKLPQVINITGLSRSSIYLAISEGRFPTQINLGARSIGFLESEIITWMEHQIANRRGSF